METYMELETLNTMEPIWKRQKSKVKPEDYNEYYKGKFGDYEDPVKVIRTSVEGVSSYTALLFIPGHTPYDYYTKDYEKGLQKLVPVSLLHEILESDHIKEAFYNQWVLREAYMKWTGEGFSRDPRTIPMDRGNSVLLEMEPGYSGAVWSENPLELRWEHLEISIP